MGENNKTRLNDKIKKYIVYFVIIMIALTVVSKVMYNMTITGVKVEMIKSGSINKYISGSAVIESTLDIPVYVSEGLYVNQIFVTNGDKVEKGDELFQVDVTKIDQMIAAKNNELTSLKLQIQDAESQEAFSDKSSDLALKQAKDNLSQAKEEYKKSIAIALKAYEDAKKAYEACLNGGQVATGTDASMLDVLEADMNAKKQAYDQLIDARDKELFLLQQAVQSASLGTADSTMTEQLSLSYTLLEDELNELIKLKAADGKIKAEMAGQIKDIMLNIGEATYSSAVMIISKTDNTLLVKSEFPAKYKDDIKAGSQVAIKSDNIETTLTADKVFVDEANNVVVVYSNIQDENIVIGERLDANLVTKAVSYENVVPLSALSINGYGKYCIHTYDISKTIIGTEAKAREIQVEVLDKDNYNAAISGSGISMGVEVIVESQRVITNESKVKVIER